MNAEIQKMEKDIGKREHGLDIFVEDRGRIFL